MTEKKKKYLSPEIKVVEMSAADIICTSGTDIFSLGDDGTLELGSDTDWGTDLGW